MKLSVITPAYNEADNLGNLHARLVQTLDALRLEWEWVVVDDHSRDRTFEIISALAERDPRIHGIRLARNSGSHTAITCGLHHATGDAAAMIAGDLQDPPETLRAMLERWRAGAHVVWGVRRERPGDRAHARFAAVYYWIMRHPVGMKEMPAQGADLFLVDRLVIDAIRTFPERHVSVLALITWLGFRQEFVDYDKQPRTAGRSGWTAAKKIALVLDSVTSFSAFPIRGCAAAGDALVLAGAGLAAVAFTQAGLAAAVLVVLAAVVGLAGAQLIALGVLGEYVWRALDEARRRPLFVVEAMTPRRVPDTSARMNDLPDMAQLGRPNV